MMCIPPTNNNNNPFCNKQPPEQQAINKQPNNIIKPTSNMVGHYGLLGCLLVAFFVRDFLVVIASYSTYHSTVEVSPLLLVQY